MAVAERPVVAAEPRRPRRRLQYRLQYMLCAALGSVAVIALGAATSTNRATVFAVALCIVALPLLQTRPVVWIGMALAISWTSRLFSTTGLGPRFLDFLDFPLTVVALLAALATQLGRRGPLPAAQGAIGRRVLVVAAVMTVSWGFRDIAEPQRLLGALVLELEPFLLLMAILLAQLSAADRKGLLRLVMGLLALQIPFSLTEIAFGNRVDSVKGTLLQTGAGHHVSAGGTAIGFFLLVGLRAPKPLLIVYGVATLFVAVTADAKQVLFVLPIALLILGFAQRKKRSTSSALAGVIAGIAMAAGAAIAIVTYHASQIAFDFIDRSVTNDTGKIAVADAVWHDIWESPQTLLFGLGPGETVSRFSFLTTPELLKAGSPVEALNLHVSKGAAHYTEVSQDGPYTGVSSFTSPQSSALGVLGDYGLAGVIAVGGLIRSVIRATRRARCRGLRAATLSGWAMLLPLAVVFDWLEQPPFTLAVAVVTGITLLQSEASATFVLGGADELLDPHRTQQFAANGNPGEAGR